MIPVGAPLRERKFEGGAWWDRAGVEKARCPGVGNRVMVRHRYRRADHDDKVDGTKAKSRIATAVFGTVVAGAAVVVVVAAVVRGAVTAGGAGFVEVGDADGDPPAFVEDGGTAVEPTVGRAETFRGLGLMVVEVADASVE